MAEVNVALIGYAFMGRAHSNAYRQVGPFLSPRLTPKLKVLCGRDAKAVKAAAGKLGWEETATDWREVVARDDIDLIDVATPNYLHAEIAIAAAEAGKIVLCEKPLANSLEEARKMVSAVEKAGVANGVWFNYRRVPAVAFARELIERGALGRIFHYRAQYLQEWGTDTARPINWKMSRATAGSGVNGDLNSHLIDMALMLAGPIREVSAVSETFIKERDIPGKPGEKHQVDIEDAVLVQARFASGALGTFEATRFAIGYKNRNRFEIHGERGMLAFDLEDLNHLVYHDATAEPSLRGPRRILVTGPGHPYTANYWKPGHVIGYEHTFISALADFRDTLDGENEFHPNFEDALKVQQVLEAVEVSARERRWIEVG